MVDVFAFDLDYYLARRVDFRSKTGQVMPVGSKILIFPPGEYEKFIELLKNNGLDLNLGGQKDDTSSS